MLIKGQENREVVEIVSLGMLVSEAEDYSPRKIEAAADFGKIYEFVDERYCKDNGRPSVDLVVLFKIVMIQRLAVDIGLKCRQ